MHAGDGPGDEQVLDLAGAVKDCEAPLISADQHLRVRRVQGFLRLVAPVQPVIGTVGMQGSEGRNPTSVTLSKDGLQDLGHVQDALTTSPPAPLRTVASGDGPKTRLQVRLGDRTATPRVIDRKYVPRSLA